ncbi:HIT family protein [Parahaliea aestuarii]|uniref:HIT family protein n=1 Tax=Parahaliea aestuarii TaxID=1852021 RepID=A0A5C8ZYK0_9GAMM|nr:HIT family protein [Parahaliea aestuarii]TXS93576.1 HIT family protein [Parahaliea aestuarii]
MPTLHPQLAADTHLLGTMDSGTLLLSRNASLHWLILVPESEEADLLDLAPPQLLAVMADCRALSAFLKSELGYPKVNFAGLGNVVPQMHLHIVGRREGDACWPQPVWGQLPEGPLWSDSEVRELRDALTAGCGLRVND